MISFSIYNHLNAVLVQLQYLQQFIIYANIDNLYNFNLQLKKAAFNYILLSLNDFLLNGLYSPLGAG